MVKIVNLESLLAKLASLGGSANNALRKAVHTTGVSARDDAKRHAPVAPIMGGTLKDSISESMKTGETGGMITSIVYTNVPYAIYQEMGTYKMAAHPYMMPAFHENEGVLEAQAKKELLKAIHALGG